jgi:tRNA (mo5U34)-methyltransferase
MEENLSGVGGVANKERRAPERAPAADIENRVRELAPWFHDLDLHGVRTAPDHPLGSFLQDLWSTVEPAFPADMTGATVLDIGCNAGFYTFELADRGARVTGIDHNPHYLRQARYAAEVLGHDVELLEMEAYDVIDLGRRFDYVLFMGVLYHLRYPLLALDRIREVVGRRLVFQTLVRGATETMEGEADYPFDEEAVFDDPRFPRLHFIEHRYAGDPTNWWIANDSAAAALLRAAGFRIQEHASAGVFFCGNQADVTRPEPGLSR